MNLSRHRVPASTFTLLAHGYADAMAMELLWAGRLSKQLLLIRAVIDTARPHRPALAAADLDRAVQLIDHTQRQNPAAAAQVLGYPLVGAWAARCLRRLGRSTGSDKPLWVELAHLAAVAVAAGIRAGREVALPVPVRGGAASLPTLGRARLGGGSEWGVAMVRGDAGGYVVEGEDRVVRIPLDPQEPAPGWEPVHRVELAEAGRRLTILLDDLDPYRHHGLPSADRLRPAELARWREQLAQAWNVLVRHHPDRSTELASGPVTLVPLADATVAPQVSATTRDSPGAMAVSPPPDPFTLALSMVHEFQHSKLGGLLDLVELYDVEDRRPVYSPWRADPRRVGGLLQGSYAFLAVGGFWARHAETDTRLVSRRVAEYELARTAGQVRTAVRELDRPGTLTEPGVRFVAGIGSAAEALAARPVGAEPARLARLAQGDHRIGWRLRNLQVDPEAVEALAVAWRRGERRPPGHPPSRVTGEPPTYTPQPLHEQIVARLDAPTRTVTGPDEALLCGDHHRAADGYLARVRAEPERWEPWAGLALARQRTGPDPVARVYAGKPELVATLYRRLATSGVDTDPDAVAGWLAG